jgi:hypothetical protein
METKQEDTPFSTVFRGMYILGAGARIDSVDAAALSTQILLGNHDRDLKHFLYWRDSKKLPEKESDVETTEVLAKLANIKSYIRHQVQALFDEAEADLVRERKRNFDQLISDIKDSSKPHPLGTVAQLATRFNLSKSEVRRMRTAGTLDQFLNEKLGTPNA